MFTVTETAGARLEKTLESNQALDAKMQGGRAPKVNEAYPREDRGGSRSDMEADAAVSAPETVSQHSSIMCCA